MKKINILIFLCFFFFSCKKEEMPVFAKVEYYHNNSELLPPPDDGTVGYEINFYESATKKNINFYKKLEQYGFKKKKINKNNEDLKLFFANKDFGKNFAKYNCLNFYKDILVFYGKDDNILGIAKFDFKCKRYFYTNFSDKKIFFLKRNCEDYIYLLN